MKKTDRRQRAIANTFRRAGRYIEEHGLSRGIFNRGICHVIKIVSKTKIENNDAYSYMLPHINMHRMINSMYDIAGQEYAPRQLCMDNYVYPPGECAGERALACYYLAELRKHTTD